MDTKVTTTDMIIQGDDSVKEFLVRVTVAFKNPIMDSICSQWLCHQPKLWLLVIWMICRTNCKWSFVPPAVLFCFCLKTAWSGRIINIYQIFFIESIESIETLKLLHSLFYFITFVSCFLGVFFSALELSVLSCVRTKQMIWASGSGRSDIIFTWIFSIALNKTIAKW